MTNRQKQVIIGTVLGGSSLCKTQKGKNFYLLMRGKNLIWLQKKAGELINLSNKKNVIERDGTYRWNSKCLTEMSELSKYFFKNKTRYLKIEILDNITDLGLAVWYLDCGNYINEQIILNTNIWGLRNSQKIQKYFKLLDYKSKIKKIKNSINIILDKPSSENFLQTISHCLSEFKEPQ